MTGTLDPRTEVLSPSGANVTECTSATTANDQTCLLPTTGTYTVLVRDNVNNATGTYRLSVQSLTAPVGCTTLSFDALAVSGTVAVVGDAVCYRFVAGPGTADVVRLRVLEAGGTWTTLTDVIRPDGSAQAFPCTATTGEEFTCNLTVAGTYTILVRDNVGPSTGDLRLSLQRLNDPGGCAAAPLAFGGDPTLGTIDTTVQTDCHRFTGTAGDRVRVRTVGVTGTLDPRTEVLSPAGANVTECTSATTANDQTCLLPATGTYTVLVRDNVNNATGTYRIGVQSLTAPVGCQTVVSGNGPIPASVSTPGAMGCHRFTGTSGNVVRVRVTETSGSLLALTDVVRPDGTAQAFPCTATTSADFTCTLSQTGTHTIVVRDNAGTNTGGYRVEIGVDTTAPETTIDDGPPPTTADPTPTFEFSSDDPNASFACKVDAGAFAACSSPFTSPTLADGSHTFQVRATDLTQNTDATPAVQTFDVQTSGPDTMITSGPSGATNDATPAFEFSSPTAGASFECRLDASQFAPCTSPTALGRSRTASTRSRSARSSRAFPTPRPPAARSPSTRSRRRRRSMRARRVHPTTPPPRSRSPAIPARRSRAASTPSRPPRARRRSRAPRRCPTARTRSRSSPPTPRATSIRRPPPAR